MKKILAEMVIKWSDQGCAVREIAKLMPQVNPEEIKIVVSNHRKERENGQQPHL